MMHCLDLEVPNLLYVSRLVVSNFHLGFGAILEKWTNKGASVFFISALQKSIYCFVSIQ